MPGDSFLVVIGAACGVLAILFVLAAGKLWTLTIPRLFRRWTYRGARVAGEWKGLGAGHAPASGEWSEVALSLEQDTVHVRGLMVIRHQSAGHAFDLSLQAEGRIWQGYLTLNLSPVRKTITSCATALLKIERGGALNGQLLFRNPFADTVDVINVSVHQAESVATPRLHPASRPVLEAQAS